MAYDVNNSVEAFFSHAGGQQVFKLVTTDREVDILEPGYVTNAASRGMRVNDLLLVTYSETSTGDIFVVSYINASGAGTLTLFTEELSSISPTDYGAVGDGVTDDTDAFDDLEESNTGKKIDLGGFTYLVDAIPQKNQYYNGWFKVGTRSHFQGEVPQSNPLGSQPHMKAVVPLTNGYAGFAIALYDDRTGRCFLVARHAVGHRDDQGSIIKCAISNDLFNSLNPGNTDNDFPSWFRSIFSDPAYDLRNPSVGMLPNYTIIGAFAAGAGGTNLDLYGDPRLIKCTNPNAADVDDIAWTVAKFSTLLGGGIGVSAITQANPGELTLASAHGLIANQRIHLASVGGMVELVDETYYVETVVSPTVITISTEPGGTAIDTSAYTAFTTGGTLYKGVTPDSCDFHGKLIPYPAAVGGHDTLGGILTAYTTSHGICMYSSVDGYTASITEHLGVVTTNPGAGVNVASEIDVVQGYADNRWYMIIRNTGDNTKLAFSVSETPLSGWTPAVLTPLIGGRTSVTIWKQWGLLWVMASNRRTNLNGDVGMPNAVKIAYGDPEVVFASGGASGWSDWIYIGTGEDWNTGYWSRIFVNNKTYVLGTTGEDQVGNTDSQQCYLTLIGQDPPVAPSVSTVASMIPQKNMLPQGGFQYWPAGTSVETGAARKTLMARMTVARNDGSAGVVFSLASGKDDSAYELRVRRSNGDTNVNPGNICINFPQVESLPFQEFKRQAVVVSFDAKCSPSFSATNKELRVVAKQTGSSSEVQVTANTGFYPNSGGLASQVVTSSNVGVFLNEYYQRFQVIFDDFDAAMKQFLINISAWDYIGTADEDFFDIRNIKIEPGRRATPFQLERLADVILDSQLYYQKITGIRITPTSEVRIGFGAPMIRIPDVADTGGSVSGETTRHCYVIGAQTGISNITQANPGVITVVSDLGFYVDAQINVRGIAGMVEITDGTYFITEMFTATTFSISATKGGTPIDTTGFTPYSAGGTDFVYIEVTDLTIDANL